MNQSHINRSVGLKKASKQFERDLQSDPEFIKFKKASEGFGLPIATQQNLILNRIGISSEQLIKSL